MNYKETLDYLYSQMPEYQRIGHLAYKEGLDNIEALDKLFDHPHRKFKTIHIGGTNGKGSVSHLLAATLQEAGYKTGLYTSPHLLDFRERIKVNGEMIDKDFVIEFVNKHHSKFESIMPSFFELTTIMAFLYFEIQHVDVAVIEVGLGGRLDSTNIITPELSIITNIGKDHTQYLGDTLPKIAGEKAGIIKRYTPAVIGEMGSVAVNQVFIDKSKSTDSPLIFAEIYMNNFKAERTEQGWVFQADGYPDLIGELKGSAQDKNARTVLTAIEVLKEIEFNIPQAAVYKGFANVVELTGLMGRWQQLQSSPKTVCDIAHNPHGIRYIVEQFKIERFGKLHIVFGIAKDKDMGSILALLPKDAIYYFTRASIERAMDEEQLRTAASEFQLIGDSFKTVAEAIDRAKENADKDDFIFIGGSAFVVADALAYYQTNTIRKI